MLKTMRTSNPNKKSIQILNLYVYKYIYIYIFCFYHPQNPAGKKVYECSDRPSDFIPSDKKADSAIWRLLFYCMLVYRFPDKFHPLQPLHIANKNVGNLGSSMMIQNKSTGLLICLQEGPQSSHLRDFTGIRCNFILDKILGFPISSPF